MMRVAVHMAGRVARLLLLLSLVATGTLALVRYAPGYFADARELEAHAEVVRSQLEAQRNTDRSLSQMMRNVAGNWLHGELGVSRQFHVPVQELIAPRLLVTGRILLESLLLGWSLASVFAIVLSAHTSGAARGWVAAGSAVLLAIPIGALATVCLLTDKGGPVLALSILLAARDFKFAYQLLRTQWQAQHLFYARAQGTRATRLVLVHLLRPVLPQLASLLTMSFIAALSFSVPSEVLFDVPGIGQLAWSAAMNRDLPLLLAITLVMAAAVGCAGLLSEPAVTNRLQSELA